MIAQTNGKRTYVRAAGTTTTASQVHCRCAHGSSKKIRLGQIVSSQLLVELREMAGHKYENLRKKVD